MNIMFSIGSLRRGGAERVVANLANNLSKSNKIVIVLSDPTINYEIKNNVAIKSIKSKFKIKSLFIFNRIIRQTKPDVIVSFLPEPSFKSIIMKIFNKVPVIVSERNDPKREYANIKRRMLAKTLYSYADGLVFQTEEAKNYFSTKIQNKSTIIPNPVSNIFLNAKITSDKREKVIVSVGRLEQQKNHKLLINAFSESKANKSGYKLIIYGSGAEEKKLKEQINTKGEQDTIQLKGEVNNIINEIKNSKLFILPSDYEGMPNALMEAMSIGLVCASSDCPCGGPRQLIKNNENGYLFEVGNIEQLKSIIDNVCLRINDKKYEKISQNAKNSMKKYSEQIIYKKWLDYITSVVNINIKDRIA